MRISSRAYQDQNLVVCLCIVLIILAMFVLTTLAADGSKPSSNSHGIGMISIPPQAGHIFIVNSTADAPDVAPGDGQCDSNISVPGEQCTLRAAIMEANASQGDDTIRFNFPICSINHDPQCRISLLTALPEIFTNIEFDGPGAKRLLITPTGGVRAFLVTTSGTVVISGMTIDGEFGSLGDFGGLISNAGTGTLNIINSDIES